MKCRVIFEKDDPVRLFIDNKNINAYHIQTDNHTKTMATMETKLHLPVSRVITGCETRLHAECRKSLSGRYPLDVKIYCSTDDCHRHQISTTKEVSGGLSLFGTVTVFQQDIV